MDRGLILGKRRGSFARFQALTGNLSVDSGGNESRPSDGDRAAQEGLGAWGGGALPE